jgi:hypothetical protein
MKAWVTLSDREPPVEMEGEETDDAFMTHDGKAIYPWGRTAFSSREEAIGVLRTRIYDRIYALEEEIEELRSRLSKVDP